EVIAEYRSLIASAPREPRFVVELAQVLLSVGRRDEAISLAESTGRKHPRDVAVHRALADLYTRFGEERRAASEIALLARIDAQDPAHLIALGAQQLGEGNREAAITTFRRILTAVRDRGEAHGTLARVYADHDLLDLAEQEYRLAVTSMPDEVRSLRGLAEVLERIREGETRSDRQRRDLDAIASWQKVLEGSGDDRVARREARRRIVGIWARRGQLRSRVAEWERAFDATPPDAEAGRFLAEARLQTRPPDTAGALAVLAKLSEIAPGDIESLLALERARVAAGDRAGAIDVLGRLLEADPRRAPHYLERMSEHAHALYRDGDAVRYAEEAVRRQPDDAQAHRRLGDLYRARQDMDRAVASYNRAIERNDRLFSTYFELAEIHVAAGRLTEADRLYRHVLRLC
ncbi:MAG: tetratricopeptide repeat protein, partial [Polyangiaceae bacterium]|nr:tetratricopeptide repeat protein [Polyangiaceae bacterium]